MTAKRIKIKWNSEKILSLSAMAMSFLTLLIFIYQTNLMSRQNYLSILPYLQLSYSNNPEAHSFSLSLKNHGVGPAILESVRLKYKGSDYNVAEYDYELLSLLRELDPSLDSLKTFNFATLEEGIAIPANTSYTILSVANSPEDYKLLLQSLDRIEREGVRYEIGYKSLQDEHWIIHDDSAGPKRID
ncbi:hypothetical protein [Robiginitalea sp. IMCC43444]|uniref:hypothetical protein n=1 Tax=Robiginitalea sp. IMCC43444 TaxID=3459121 RepID=UPI004041CE62